MMLNLQLLSLVTLLVSVVGSCVVVSIPVRRLCPQEANQHGH